MKLSSMSTYLPEVGECEKCEFVNMCGGGSKCIVPDSKFDTSASHKSNHKFVYWNTSSKKWFVMFQRGNTNKYCGSFSSLEDAIKTAEKFEVIYGNN